MMKFLLWSLLIFANIQANGQNFIEDNFPTKDGRIYYSEVISVDSSISATDLYLSFKDWLIDAFKSSKAVIELDDKEAKVIVVKCYLQKEVISNALLDYTYDRKIWFSMKVETKDGRFRASIYDVISDVQMNMQNSPISVEEPIEDSFSKLELPEKEKQRTKLIDSTNNFCKELNTDFRNIYTSLEKRMSAKANKDW